MKEINAINDGMHVACTCMASNIVRSCEGRQRNPQMKGNVSETKFGGKHMTATSQGDTTKYAKE